MMKCDDKSMVVMNVFSYNGRPWTLTYILHELILMVSVPNGFQNILHIWHCKIIGIFLDHHELYLEHPELFQRSTFFKSSCTFLRKFLILVK